jgi:predicted RNA-binding protein Jag
MKWNYKLTTNTIWASFDFGEVEADTREEAIFKAKSELQLRLNIINHALTCNLNTKGIIIGMDLSQIEVSQIIVPLVAKLVYFNFVTRVLVPEDATDDQIVDAARSKILVKVEDELHENLEEIIDDIECPVQLEELLP